MLIFAYNFIWSLLSPLIPIWLTYRIYKDFENKKRIFERYGVSRIERPKGKLIWVHASSLGESVSASAMAIGLREKGFKGTILITSGTTSSYELLKHNEDIIHQFHPYDKKNWVEKFLNHWKPCLAIMMESEIWPNFIICSHNFNIPILMASAQISQTSYLKWKQLLGRKTKVIFSKFSLILCYDEEQKNKFERLGAKNVQIGGNLKTAMPPPKINRELINKIKKAASGKKIILLASSHSGEEKILLESIEILESKGFETFFIIAPRKISRGQNIIHKYNINAKLISKNEELKTEDKVLVFDKFGEMASLYSVSNIVFVAGSLFPLGGHNPSEPCHFKTNIIIGPHVSKCKETVEEMNKNNAIIKIKESDNYPQEIADVFYKLLKEEKFSKSLSNSSFKMSTNWAKRRAQSAEKCLDFLGKRS